MVIRQATKNQVEREDEEAGRLVRPSPKLKPPRHDRRRERVKVDRDPDTDQDPDLKGDPDLSLNYKSIGGSQKGAREVQGKDSGLLGRTFPPRLSTALSRLSQEDVNALVSHYQKFMSLGRMRLSSVEKELSKAYPLTLTRVGNIEDLAARLSIRSRAITALSASGLPLRAASLIVDFALTTPVENRSGKVSGLAETLFSLGGSSHDVADERFGTSSTVVSSDLVRGDRVKVIASFSDPSLRALLASVYQGGDLRRKESEFVSNPISGQSSVQDIVSRVKEAESFFSEQAKGYPSELPMDPSRVFRSKILEAVSSLDKAKADRLARELAKQDALTYRQRLRDYRQALGTYKNKVSEWVSGGRVGPCPLLPAEPVAPPEYNLFYPPSREGVRSRLDEVLGGQGYSTYPNQECMPKPIVTAMYHGVEPYPEGHEGFAPYVGWQQAHARDLGPKDFDSILAEARKWLGGDLWSGVDTVPGDIRLRSALDLAIRSIGEGRYSGAITANVYNMLLGRLGAKISGRTSSSCDKSREEGAMTAKFAKEDANRILGRLDKLASNIQENYSKWGMGFETAREIVNDLDRTADEIEKAAFGEQSFLTRQVEVLKAAKVLQKDSDEGYMDTFNAPTAPIQSDADEGYMSMFKDDQTEAVASGKSSTGRPLAP